MVPDSGMEGGVCAAARIGAGGVGGRWEGERGAVGAGRSFADDDREMAFPLPPLARVFGVSSQAHSIYEVGQIDQHA